LDNGGPLLDPIDVIGQELNRNSDYSFNYTFNGLDPTKKYGIRADVDRDQSTVVEARNITMTRTHAQVPTLYINLRVGGPQFAPSEADTNGDGTVGVTDFFFALNEIRTKGKISACKEASATCISKIISNFGKKTK
jgi:hypothetical protein